MRRMPPSTGWFGALRRDRALFALVGALAVLLGLLQPAAAARNAAFADLMVLCGTDLVPGERLPAPDPDCRLCPVGHVCAPHGLLSLPSQAASLPPAPAEIRLPPSRSAPHPLAAGAAASPSIRAPPLPA